MGKKVDDTLRSIAGLASRDMHQSSRVLGARYELTAYACYEPAVELFDERCFDISQVCPVTFVTLLQLLYWTTNDTLLAVRCLMQK